MGGAGGEDGKKEEITDDLKSGGKGHVVECTSLSVLLKKTFWEMPTVLLRVK